MDMNTYYVYILTNKLNTVLYIGVTNNIERRVYEHKNKLIEGFTSKYNCDKLIYYEETNSIETALIREKVLKGWTRVKKENLIKDKNQNFDEIVML